MPRLSLFFTCFLLLFSLAAEEEVTTPTGNAQAAAVKEKAVVIPIEGGVRGLLMTTLKRRTEAAIERGIKVIIYRVKSDGGELGAAMEMSNYVFGLDSEIKTIAYVEAKAYSAAALFSLACDDLYMKPGSAIGDCEPILPTSEGYVTAGEKIQTVLKERFRTFAKTNGYPVELSQAMVSSNLKIFRAYEKESGKMVYFRSENWDILSDEEKSQYERRSIVCHEGELLTVSDSEAIELGFSHGTFNEFSELLAHLGYDEEAEVVDFNETEKVVDFFDQIAGLVLIAALFFLYMEFKTPGMGAFGSLAALCFCAFFIGKLYQGQANYLEILLFVLGMVLIALELFVFPGFGIAGLAGLALLFISLVLAMQDFNIPTTDIQHEMLMDNIVSVCLSFLGATVIFVLVLVLVPKGKNKASFLSGLIHRDHQQVSPEFKKVEHDQADFPSMLGFRGETSTILCPSGKMLYQGEVYSVTAREGFIEKGVEVEVVEQEGNQLMVKLIEEEQEHSQNYEQV
jgi:membrane-bound serine protease (ClpP class)